MKKADQEPVKSVDDLVAEIAQVEAEQAELARQNREKRAAVRQARKAARDRLMVVVCEHLATHVMGDPIPDDFEKTRRFLEEVVRIVEGVDFGPLRDTETSSATDGTSIETSSDSDTDATGTETSSDSDGYTPQYSAPSYGY